MKFSFELPLMTEVNQYKAITYGHFEVQVEICESQDEGWEVDCVRLLDWHTDKWTDLPTTHELSLMIERYVYTNLRDEIDPEWHAYCVAEGIPVANDNEHRLDKHHLI